MTDQVAFTANAIFDGARLWADSALLLRDGRVAEICSQAEIPSGMRQQDLGPGTIAPGFVDLQVNGGGGVMFNDDPSVATLVRMATAHARIGATSILPTLITDTPDQIKAAIAATAAATAVKTPGILGLHLEGPHLSQTRKGAHDPALIRPMQDADLAVLIEAAQVLPVLMVTLAAEAATPEQIRALAAAGIIVSLGHSDAGFDACAAAAKAGASCVTHLFNAMSQLTGREPGLVGAALSLGGLAAGLIADGIHVHPTTVATALTGKQGPGAVFLVSDAMATAGSKISSFLLNGRRITRSGDRLTLADGTLAGAHLELATALRHIVDWSGVGLEQAITMTGAAPARVIGMAGSLGHLRPGAAADFLHLDDGLSLTGSWRYGAPIEDHAA